MKAFLFVGALAIGAALPLSSAVALDPVDSYVARISENDHYNSSGDRLTKAAAVIRQDRANYHAFGLRDPEDEPDSYFVSREARERMERFLRRGGAGQSAIDTIVNGTPLIEVVIYPDSIEVLIME